MQVTNRDPGRIDFSFGREIVVLLSSIHVNHEMKGEVLYILHKMELERHVCLTTAVSLEEGEWSFIFYGSRKVTGCNFTRS